MGGKRPLEFVLLVVLVFGCLILPGCGQRGADRPLSVWHQMEGAGREVLQKQLDRFMESHPGWEVTQLYKETEELRTHFQTAALAGSGPDLVYGPADQIGPFETMGLIQPLENLVSPDTVDWAEGARVYFGGHLYQIADRVGNHLALVYNRDLLQDPPLDTAELIRIGKGLTRDLNGDGRLDQYALVWNYSEPFFFIPFLSGFGGWVVDEESHPTLNTPEMVAALRFCANLKDLHRIAPLDADRETADALFKGGRAAMIINGSWAWGGYTKAGIDYGVARIPRIEKTGRWPAPMISAKGYSININVRGERLVRVTELLEFLTGAEVQIKFSRALHTVPARISARESAEVGKDDLLRQSIRQFEVGRPMPIVPEMRAIWDAMRPNYQAVMAGTKSPPEAARDMQALAEQRIAEMNE
ncbi:MAG: extracellular solute-binding protein [Candidatus Eisenbacteria sp.]|nr:extracellular solute-binding protein [Candidatus Eisenbacteria bacterium]